MSWGNTGWDLVDVDETKAKQKFGPKRFWMPPEKTKRIMFLGDDPFVFHEHSLWNLTKTSAKEICLKRNGIGDECPLCDAEMWPSVVGAFTIIDMGDVVPGKKKGETKLEGWTNDKGQTFQFGRKLYTPKRGGKDKPGILRKIQRLSEKKGGLIGTVWDVYRSGQKVESVGDEFEFVERVDKDKWTEYLVNLGANPEYLSLEVIDYNKAFQPSSVEELRGLVGGTPKVTETTPGGVEKVDLGDDDDIPFDL